MNPLQEHLDKIEEETIKEIEEQFRFESHQRHLENVLITYIKGYEKNNIVCSQSSLISVKDWKNRNRFLQNNLKVF